MALTWTRVALGLYECAPLEIERLGARRWQLRHVPKHYGPGISLGFFRTLADAKAYAATRLKRAA
jgi:hypothetical protein